MPVRNTRRRYLYAVFTSELPLMEDSVKAAIEDEIHYLYGVTGYADMDMRLIEWDMEKQAAIIRVNHKLLEKMRTTLSHISSVGESKTRVDVKRVSGTIKSLKSKI